MTLFQNLTHGKPGWSLIGKNKASERDTSVVCSGSWPLVFTVLPALSRSLSVSSIHCIQCIFRMFTSPCLSLPFHSVNLQANEFHFRISLLLASPFTWGLAMWVKSLSHVRLFATPWTVAHQAPPSMGFSRQEYWSGVPFPPPGGLSDPAIEPGSPALQTDALLSEPPGKPWGLAVNVYKRRNGDPLLILWHIRHMTDGEEKEKDASSKPKFGGKERLHADLHWGCVGLRVTGRGALSVSHGGAGWWGCWLGWTVAEEVFLSGPGCCQYICSRCSRMKIGRLS